MLSPCFKYESGLQKTDMHVVSRSILLPHMQKSQEALADASKSIRKRTENNEHTVAVLCQRHDFILLYHFLDFFVF